MDWSWLQPLGEFLKELPFILMGWALVVMLYSALILVTLMMAVLVWRMWKFVFEVTWEILREVLYNIQDLFDRFINSLSYHMRKFF